MPYTPQTWIDGAPGGTPLSAARLNFMETGIQNASVSGGAFINVKSFGAVGNGVANDTTAIQNAINSASPGDTVWFPSGTYLVSSTIVFPGKITLMGGGGISVGTTIRATGAISGAVLASNAWVNNLTVCDSPVRIVGLEIDGNNVGATLRGIAVVNFWSRIEDCQIRNTTGNGIELNDRTANGTNIVTNSASENTIINCRFVSIAGDGVFQQSNNGASNQDGRVQSCFFSSITGTAIRLDRAAGWYVQNNHIYTIGIGAIRAANCYATTITNNYVEDFGGNDVAATFYTGILMTSVLNARASILMGNTVSTLQPASPNASRFTCYAIVAGSAQTRANVVVVGNSAHFASGTAPTVKKSRAFELGSAAGGQLNIDWACNQIENSPNWQDTRVITQPAQVVLRDAARLPLTDAATIVTDAAFGDHFYVTLGANRTLAVPLNPTDGQRVTWEFIQDASGSRTITLATGAGGFALGTDITAVTLTTTAAKRDYMEAVYNRTSDRWHVVQLRKGF